MAVSYCMRGPTFCFTVQGCTGYVILISGCCTLAWTSSVAALRPLTILLTRRLLLVAVGATKYSATGYLYCG